MGCHGLTVPDGQDVIAAAAGDAVLAHERLSRFEHRLATEHQCFGIIFGEPK